MELKTSTSILEYNFKYFIKLFKISNWNYFILYNKINKKTFIYLLNNIKKRHNYFCCFGSKTYEFYTPFR